MYQNILGESEYARTSDSYRHMLILFFTEDKVSYIIIFILNLNLASRIIVSSVLKASQIYIFPPPLTILVLNIINLTVNNQK